MTSKFEKYIVRAKDLNMIDGILITPEDIRFDIRAILKCRWGCDDFYHNSIRCHVRDTTYQERVEMIKNYNHILLLHSHNAHELSKAIIDIERMAFLDDFYFAFGIRFCNLCKDCKVTKGQECPTPSKVRPCDQSFGIDVYKTVRNLGLPCKVLQNKDDIQNRYGFILLD